MDEVDRDDLIDLLEQLGSADDAEVLAAARALHRRVSESGLTWDDLLAWTDEDEEAFESEPDSEPEFEPEFEEDEAAEAEGMPPAAARRVVAAVGAPGDPDSLTDDVLIDRILGECDVSDETRQDLLDLKGDLGRGEFTEMDRKYIRALYGRLRPSG